METNAEFRAVNHPGVAYTPRGDGGMLVTYDSTCVRIYVNGPSELPWAAEKSKSAPQWKRTQGSSTLDFGRMRVLVDAYGQRGPFRPGELQARTDTRTRAYVAFMQLMDPAHLDEVTRVRLRGFNYYCALRRVPGLHDLACTGIPTNDRAGGTALAYALSNFGYVAPRRYARPFDVVRRLVRGKRRDMVVALGFPKDTANLAVRALERLRLLDLHLEEISELRDLFVTAGSATLKRIAHLDALNIGIIRLLSQPHTRDAVSIQLLDEIGAPRTLYGQLVDIPSTLDDTVRMLRARGAHVPIFRTVHDMRHVHDAEMRRVLNNAHAPTTLGQRLPDAPVPPVPGDIEYLGTTGALAAEGRTMHNCVHTYDDRVMTYECFIYRVLSPERCTLAIELGPDLRFRIRELKSYCNAPTAPATVAHVENWLRTHQLEAVNHDISTLSLAARNQAWGSGPPLDHDIYDVPC